MGQFIVTYLKDPKGVNFSVTTWVEVTLEIYVSGFKEKMPVMEISLQGWLENVTLDVHPLDPGEAAHLLPYEVI